jgi:hypothetical protein
MRFRSAVALALIMCSPVAVPAAERSLAIGVEAPQTIVDGDPLLIAVSL